MKYEELGWPEKGSTVIVGMSGGVDSTLVTLLLKERGCNVIGVTMSSWNNDLPLKASSEGLRNSCYGPDEKIDIEECKRFCKQMNIPHYVIDVREAYRKEVLDYFRSEYRKGRTPNPCVRCNRLVKFGALLDGASNAGINFDYFCTGHYARLIRPEENLVEDWNIKNEKGIFPVMVSNALDITKDQAYFLARIASSTLEKVRFPLGTYTKKEVFEIAREHKLEAANRTESQDFVPPEYFDIIFSDKPPVPGTIIDLDGHILGKHKGIEYYTIGQRRGLGVSAPKPLYVHSIDAEKNQVILASNEDLLVEGLWADDWVWPGNVPPCKPFEAKVKIRLATPPVDSVIEPVEKDGRPMCKVTFKTPQRAVAPGQAVVAFIDNVIVGCGLILEKI